MIELDKALIADTHAHRYGIEALSVFDPYSADTVTVAE
jgi:hypothetical protein